MTIPTFDEWFLEKHGITFDDAHMQGSNTYTDAFRALTRAMRDYISEVAQVAGESND